MFVAAAVLSLVLAVAFVGTGAQKLGGRPAVVDGLGRLGVSPTLVRVIGSLEIAGAAGLAAGLAIAWLGAAAAVGLTCLMVGAVAYHVRADDYADPRWRGPALMPPVLLVLTAAAAVLRLATM